VRAHLPADSWPVQAPAATQHHARSPSSRSAMAPGLATRATCSSAIYTAVLWARLQLAANMTFHILLPTITLALGWVLQLLGWR